MKNYLKEIFSFFNKKQTTTKTQTRNYDAGRTDRFGSSWNPTQGKSAEQIDTPYRDRIKTRARDLERNCDVLEAIVNGVCRNVIGNGIKVQSRILDDKNNDATELNQQIENLWKEWTKARNCDITGTLNFTEMQNMVERRKMVDGEIFVIKVIDKTAKIPFKLQLLESDALDTNENFKNADGTKCVKGIELDANNKAIAYHFLKNVDDFYSSDSVRIPAKNVIHLFKKTRPSQIRGISHFANVINKIKDVQDYMEAEIVKQRINACYAVFIETENSQARLGRLPNENENQEDEEERRIDFLEPGMIEYLKKGEKITTATPNSNATNTKDFVEILLRQIGAGLGLSYEMVSRSMASVNFSSARQSMLEDRKTFQQHQNFLIEHFIHEVYTEFVISAVNSKQIEIKDFWQNKDRYLAHECVTSGWTWIDPLKEVNASKEELKSGITTLAHVASSHGRDWKDILLQRAREQKFAEELGLKLDIDENDIENPEIGGNVKNENEDE